MTVGQFPLQTALFSKLNSDSNLTSTLGAGVYDDVPQGSAYPFVQIGDDTTRDYSTKDVDGSETTISIHVWSRGHGSMETKQIMDRIHTLLHDVSLSVSGYNYINGRFEFADVLRDPDGITRHGVMRFRAVMLGTN